MKKQKRRKSVLIFRVSQDERALILANAIRYCGGNLSRWLRQAAANHRGGG